jgi:hypothetical protein
MRRTARSEGGSRIVGLSGRRMRTHLVFVALSMRVHACLRGNAIEDLADEVVLCCGYES